MQTLTYTSRSLRLLARLNFDRFLMTGALGIALYMAAHFAQTM